MTIELTYNDGKVTLRAIDGDLGTVAFGEGESLEDTVRALVSKFADLQNAALAALEASGLIRYIPSSDGGLS